MKSLLSVAILIMVTLSSGMAVSADANLQARVWTDSDVYHPGDNINVWIAVNESCTAQLTFTKSNVPSTNFITMSLTPGTLYQTTTTAGELGDWTVNLEAWTSTERAYSTGSFLVIEGQAECPSVRVIDPLWDISVTPGGRISISWDGSDPDGDPTKVSLFYDTDTEYYNAGHTTIAQDLTEDGIYIWDTTGVPSGSYHILAVISDNMCVSWGFSAGTVSINDTQISNICPTVSITTPVGMTIVTQGEPVNIAWDGDDPDDAATVSLYYDTDNNWSNGGYSQIAAGLHEDGSISWDTTGVPEGSYYIAASISDGQCEAYISYSEWQVGVFAPVSNVCPDIYFLNPVGSFSIMQGDTATLSWDGNDPDDAASVSLYYDTDAVWSNGGATLIASGLSEDGTYNWSTAGIPAGDYYLVAVISDGMCDISYYAAPFTVVSTTGDGPSTDGGEVWITTKGGFVVNLDKLTLTPIHIPFTNPANYIALDQTYAWVTLGNNKKMARINRSDSSITEIDAAGDLSSIAVDSNSVWAAFFSYRGLCQIRKSDLSQTNIWLQGYVGAIAPDDNNVWVTIFWGDDQYVLRINKQDTSLQTEISVGRLPRDIAVDKRYVWVANEGDNTVSRIDKSDLSTTTVSLVTSSGGNTDIGPNGLSITSHGGIADLGPYGIATDDRFVWVVCKDSGTLCRIDKSTLSKINIKVTDTPVGVAVDSQYVWIIDDSLNTCLRVRKSDLYTETIDLGFPLDFHNGLMSIATDQ